MTVQIPDVELIVFIVPMLLALVAAYFRVDELIGRPPGKPDPGHRLCGWDEEGRPVCADPRGKGYGRRLRG